MNKDKQFLNNFETNNKEINPIHFLNFLFRKRLLISCITFFGLVFAITTQRLIKKTWAGEFQIVLSNDRQVSNPSELSMLTAFGGNEIENKLLTDVGILESPSVLMPIFEYVKNEKELISTQNKDLLFLDWKENLKIDLKKSTSILKITYKDKDKELIIPVLEKMSKAFQLYSGKKKIRNLELTKNYLINQISLFKNKSAESIKKAQEFAINEDLLIQDGLPLELERFGNDLLETKLLPYNRANTSIESIRVAASNKIRNLKEQILKIKELKDDPQQIQYIASSIPALRNEGVPLLLENVENELVNLRVKYTEEDNQIKFLLQRQNYLVLLLKERAIGILKAQIVATDAEMKSATRADGVILKYKELMREAERDEVTLLELENQYRALLLEEAKSEDPWELITIPTLLDVHVFPELKTFLLFGLFGGLGLGIFIAKYLEKKSDLIFEEEIIEEFLSLPILIANEGNLSDTTNFDPILINKIINKKENIFFIKLSEISSDMIEKYKKIIISKINKSNLIKNNFITVEYNYEEITNSGSTFLFINLKTFTFKELQKIKNRLELFEINPDGIVLQK